MSVAMVAEAAPTFALACVDTDALDPRIVRLSDYAGQWLALIFYPHDFSFVCPTELTAFSARYADFSQRGCELLGISVDSISFHQEWLTKEPANGGLGPLQFPLASDPDGTVARAYGVWIKEKKVSHRGLFIMDSRGILQYSVVHNLEEDGLPLSAMEYVEGQLLSQLIRDGLPRESAWQLVAQIASGLAAAHELGVVHGDLKPAKCTVLVE